MNLWAIFLAGLTTGGLSCLAVQGGLLAGYLAGRKNATEAETSWKDAVIPTAYFLVAKLVAYTILGALLGYVGSFLQLSIGMRVALQILVGIFMVASALKLLNVHPIFTKLEFHPPAALRRVIRKSAKGESYFTPMLLGVFTIFIPCGTTQAMEVLAIGSGSVLSGALILATFVLGTVPFFLFIGVLAHTGAKAFQGALAKVTAVLVIAIGLWTVNGGLALAGSPATVQNLVSALKRSDDSGQLVDGRRYFSPKTSGSSSALVQDGVQEVALKVTSGGYFPKEIKLKKGVPVRLKLTTADTQGCARDFVIPSLKIERILPETGEEIIEFTPTKSGALPFSCIMGMYTGKFYVN